MKGESRHLKIRIPDNIRCSFHINDNYFLKPFDKLPASLSKNFEMESLEEEDLKTFKNTLLNIIEETSAIQEVIISLLGIGYKAQLKSEGQLLQLSLGKSHKMDFTVPSNINIEIQKEKFPLMGTGDNQRISVQGKSLETMNAFADAIRKERPPEVYKGKGVLVRTPKNLQKITAFRKEGKKKKN